MILNLTRISTDPNIGTFGVLKWEDSPAPFAVTLEDPWNDNKRNISCIPTGSYVCAPRVSPTHGETFEVLDVENRTHILFHRGNTHINTQGCILIGESFHYLNGIPSIRSSREGFDEFYEAVKDTMRFDLWIEWS